MFGNDINQNIGCFVLFQMFIVIFYCSSASVFLSLTLCLMLFCTMQEVLFRAIVSAFLPNCFCQATALVYL